MSTTSSVIENEKINLLSANIQGSHRHAKQFEKASAIGHRKRKPEQQERKPVPPPPPPAGPGAGGRGRYPVL